MPARTDLALDTHESLGGEIKGVTLDVHAVDDITVSTVEILNEEGSSVFGKDIGKYIRVGQLRFILPRSYMNETILGQCKI